MGKERNYELEDHIRGLVLAVAAFSNKTSQGLQAELAEQIGVSQRAFEGYYRSRGKIDEKVVRVLLQCAGSSRNVSRAWGERLLLLTGLGHDEQLKLLLDKLWPHDLSRSREALGSSSNLPPPAYANFIMRATPFGLLCEALAARTAVVMIEGMGGIGKTSLAREVAGRCLTPTAADRQAGIPSFDVVIWITDKDHPGRTRLSGVLDLAAELLGHPEVTRYAPNLKQGAVEQLLRAQRVLLVIDNLETITDPALIAWLPSIPEPSKVITTTRELRPEVLERGAWRVELKRMSEQEGRDFIALHSRRIGLALVDEATQRQLVAELGGNPKAIEIVLGMAKRTGRTVTQVLRGDVGAPGRELASLVATSWATLSPTERQIAQALSLFPTSVDDSVLARVAGVEMPTFYDAIQQLSELALVDTEQRTYVVETTLPRRMLHPVTRQYAEARLAEDGLFAAAAQARFVAWAVEHATSYGGHRPNEPEALAQIAAEEPALWAIFQWASDRGADREALTLARQLEFFYYTRALWGKNRDLYQRAIRAARRLGDQAELSDALALLIQMLSRQGQPEQAQDELADLVAISRRVPLQGEQFFRAQHAQALAHMALGQLETASAAWGRILEQGVERAVPERLLTGTLYWLALCRHRQGELSEARALMEESLARAQAQGNPRRAARNQIALASFALDQSQLDEAGRWLEAAQPNAQPDPEQRAHALLALGRLHATRELRDDARLALNEALTLFERMGLEPEVREVKARLGELG